MSESQPRSRARRTIANCSSSALTMSVSRVCWLVMKRPTFMRLSSRALVRLVDQPHGPQTVVHADRRCRAFPPVVERIAHHGEIGRGDVGSREGLVPLGGGELHDPVLHREDGVAAGDLPLTVSAVTGKPIADLDGAENAAHRAEHYRGVVLDRAFMRAPA